MDCDFVPKDDTIEQWPDGRPARRWKCNRPGCKRVTSPTPHSPDRIHFPCAAWPRGHEWGYWAEFALAVIGINEQGFNALRRLCGFTKPCACPERIARLNASGGFIADRLAVAGALWRRLFGWT
jgi:hypothetical protein